MSKLVTLCDGSEVLNTSREWQLECLAAWVMAMPFHKRQAWMSDIKPEMRTLVETEISKLMRNSPETPPNQVSEASLNASTSHS